MSATITPAPVRRTIRVKAAPARAFDVFTTRIGSWWPHEHSINKSSPQKEVVVEPRVGGRWFERGEDQSECQWGRVLVWEPPARLVPTRWTPFAPQSTHRKAGADCLLFLRRRRTPDAAAEPRARPDRTIRVMPRA
jgi:hypothetical protein